MTACRYEIMQIREIKKLVGKVNQDVQKDLIRIKSPNYQNFNLQEGKWYTVTTAYQQLHMV